MIGAVGGIIGTFFSYSVEFVTGLRAEHSWLLYLLPAGGLLTVVIYKLSKLQGISTNRVLESVRTETNVPSVLAPVIFACTVITHLFGGSAGRECAALQIGGSIASLFSQLFKSDERTRHTLVQCGMSALFSALFGTPLVAAVFTLEVITIGRIRLIAAIPCAVSSAIAYAISQGLSVTAERFRYDTVPAFFRL